MLQLKKLVRRVPGAKRIAKSLGLLPRSRRFFLEMLPKNSICAEIGVHKGDFSADILRSVHPTELNLIDPWKYEEQELYKHSWYGGKAGGGQTIMDDRYVAVCLRLERYVRSGQVRIHRGYSSVVLEMFPDEYFDWVYIDGNHLYEYVTQDLELSFMKTKPGGFIAGDDYGEGGWWEGGVKKAVDRFVQEMPVQVVALRNGQFVLHKPLPVSVDTS